MFATTGTFLEKLGLVGLDDLPPLAPHLPEVEELEAELSALANPVAEVAPEPGADTDHQTDPQTSAVPIGQDEEARA